ncbi:SpoIIE family protein phosphatase [Spirochaetota bacterium]
MPEFILTPTSIDNVACFIIATAITIYLISLKKKNASDWFFILYVLFMNLFFVRNFLLYSFNSPDNIRFFFSGMIFIYISLFMYVPWAYLFHKNIYKVESIISISVCTILIMGLCYLIITGSYANMPVFGFSRNTHLIKTSKFVGMASTVFPVLAIVVFIRKQYKFTEEKKSWIKTLFFPKGRAAIACRNFSFFIFFMIVVTMVGVLIYTGIIPPKVGLAIMLPISLISYFFFTVVYLNSFQHRSSFMVKIVGISLVLLLIIVSQIGTMIVPYQEYSYNNRNLEEIQFIEKVIKNNKGKNVSIDSFYKDRIYLLSKRIQYIAKRPLSDGLFSRNYSFIFNKNRNISAKLLGMRDTKNREKLIQKILKKEKTKNINIDKARTQAIKKIKSSEYRKKILTYKKEGSYHDVFNFDSYMIHYNFINDNVVYETGYRYYDFRQELHKVSRNILIILIISTILVLVILPVFFHYNLVKRLYVLLNGLREVDKGDLKISIPVDIHDEFGYVATSFNTMVSSIDRAQTELSDLNRNLEEKVNERTYELQSAMEELEATNEALVHTRDELWGEMQLAKKIQTVLLPENPEIEGYEFSAKMIPADNVGGDYYDVINVNGMNWFTIGDVSGHGVPAGLIMMMVQTSIRSTLEQNPKLEPSQLLSLVNKTISRNIALLKEDKYMTITVLLASKEGKFIFSGLHQNIYIFRADRNKVELVRTDGTWLGFQGGIEEKFPDKSLQLNPGDTMLLYTDGITEAWKKGTIRDKRDPEVDMYGDNKLAKTLWMNGTKSCEEIKEEILASLGDYAPDDDVTLVVLRKL